MDTDSRKSYVPSRGGYHRDSGRDSGRHAANESSNPAWGRQPSAPAAVPDVSVLDGVLRGILQDRKKQDEEEEEKKIPIIAAKKFQTEDRRPAPRIIATKKSDPFQGAKARDPNEYEERMAQEKQIRATSESQHREARSEEAETQPLVVRSYAAAAAQPPKSQKSEPKIWKATENSGRQNFQRGTQQNRESNSVRRGGRGGQRQNGDTGKRRNDRGRFPRRGPRQTEAEAPGNSRLAEADDKVSEPSF
eukprot:GHVP01012092.1.p1 GENE.GHVP01012092.1~~GHVP01012092.1.p1  ORF type:complete len:248 (-),score=58.54 GHVP01012092.1:114-857(-)